MVEKRKVGRPTKFTEKTKETIYEWLAQPVTLTAVCKIAQITSTTFNDWRNTGYELTKQLDNGDITEDSLSSEDKEYIEFSIKCDRIEAELEKELVNDVKNEKGGKRFVLGKRFGAYRDRTEVEHSGNLNVTHGWKDLVKGDLE